MWMGLTGLNKVLEDFLGPKEAAWALVFGNSEEAHQALQQDLFFDSGSVLQYCCGK